MSRQNVATSAACDTDLLGVRDLLESLLGLQRDLHATLRDKLGAMREADVEHMQTATAREASLVEQFGLLELQRHALLGRLALKCKRPAMDTGGKRAAAQSLRMSDVIAASPAPLQSELQSLTQSLREQMLAVADANRVVEMVSREMCDHFRLVFEAMAQGAATPIGYGRDGRTEGKPAQILDAIG